MIDCKMNWSSWEKKILYIISGSGWNMNNMENLPKFWHLQLVFIQTWIVILGDHEEMKKKKCFDTVNLWNNICESFYELIYYCISMWLEGINTLSPWQAEVRATEYSAWHGVQFFLPSRKASYSSSSLATNFTNQL